MMSTITWSTLWRKLSLWLRIAPAETEDEQFQRELRADFARKTKEIAKGKRKHPVVMTPTERREATRKISRNIKWSKNFVAAMTAPFVVRALENGGYAKDPLTGDELRLTPREMKRLEGVSRDNFKEFNEPWSGRKVEQFLAAGAPDECAIK